MLHKQSGLRRMRAVLPGLFLAALCAGGPSLAKEAQSAASTKVDCHEFNVEAAPEAAACWRIEAPRRHDSPDKGSLCWRSSCCRR